MDAAPKAKHIYLQLLDFLKNNKSCVLATVTGTQGSTPQKPGSSAIYGKNGLLAGTVGGGAVELAIGEMALNSIRTQKSGYFRFDLDNDISETEAAICGGGMSILLDANPAGNLQILESMKEADEKRVHGVLVTVCSSCLPECAQIQRFWVTAENLKNIPPQIPADSVIAAAEMLTRRNPDDFREMVIGVKEGEEKLVFLESVVPMPQLIIAGAGHVGKALSHLGKLLGFEVIVWDDRLEFANKTNLPEADKILCGQIDETLGNLHIDRDSFIVIVTRGHKNDADVLRKFIGSKSGYIGMIGSRKKIVQVRESFLKSGWATIDQWEKIFTPIGLEIGSKTVQEIAVSIAAQLIQVRNQLKNQ
jgi:xanthine dehydrogenase accessory factor